MKLPHITFAQYVALPDKSQYTFAFRYSDTLKEPVDAFGIGELIDYLFGQVKDVQDKANVSGIDWELYFAILDNLKAIKAADIGAKGVFDVWRSRVYLIRQVEAINKLEATALGGTPKPEEMAAGVEQFSEYRAFLQYDTLTGGDITKIAEIEAMDYLTCFTKLKLNANRAAYSDRLNDIMNRKRK